MKDEKSTQSADPSTSSHRPDAVSGGQALRRKAEAKLKKKGKPTPAANDVETQRLIQELQIHQIELEMQNDELIRTQAELKSTLSLYAELYAFAPVGYFTLARNGTIRRANLSGAKLMGLGLSDLIERRFGLFVSPPLRTTFNNFLEKVFTSGKKEVCEVTLEKNEPALLWVFIEAICDESIGGNEICYAIVSDISGRKQAEEELKQLSTHDMLTGLYNHGFFMEELARLERGRQFPISIVMTDVDHLKRANDKFGHAAGDILLKSLAQVLTKAFRAEDVVARIGGDEFAVILPNTDMTAVGDALGRLQHILQEHNAAHMEAPILISFGVSTTEKSDTALVDVLKQADDKMYRQKRGRDVS